MTKAVLDTVILVRGLIDPFSWSGKVIFEYADNYSFVVSPSIVAEYLKVLRRPKLTNKYRGIATRDLGAVLEFIASAVMVDVKDFAASSRESEDDKFIAMAAVGDAQFVISQDKDLLILGECEGIAFIAAEAFVRHLDTANRSHSR
ncbi:MAG: putative toxin-antitoxin system toxin component, PIN family [Thermomicrobiales bacterium]